MFEYSTAIHIHSKYSDGSGEIHEIAEFASEVGLDIILMTDHNTMKPKRDGYEGWYNSTFVIIGAEINDKNNENHYLAFGVNEDFDETLSVYEYVDLVNDAGGFGFIAHPFEKRRHMIEHPPYPWTAWDCKNFTGIEIWNHMSEWMEGLTEQNKYQRFVHPLRSVIRPLPETLKIWDDFSKERRIVGIAGVDAHAHRHNMLGFFDVEIFPYKVLFKSLRTHILCINELDKSNSLEAIQKNSMNIFEAFKSGRCFFGNYYHADIRGFRFFAEAEGQIFQMGDYIPDDFQKVRLRVKVPGIPATVRLVKNGEVIDSVTDTEAMWNIVNKAIYRVEVELEGNAWIYSNHIRFGVGNQ